LKQALLSTLGGAPVPAWSPDLQKAMAQLLGSQNSGVAASALPLVAAWDTGKSLASESAAVMKSLIAKLDDESTPAEQRAQIGASLVAARNVSAEIIPATLKFISSSAPADARARVSAALGDTGDASVGSQFVAMLTKTQDASLHEAILNQIVKRSDWSLLLVNALKAKSISLAELGPIAAARLRTHADKDVADAAIAAINELRGPQTKAKDDIIAKFLPVVQQQPNLLNGKQLFTATCLVCHQYKGDGKKEFAPDLTGMGLHPAEAILTSVVDPNREVDPSFLMINVTTKKGDSYSGIIVREDSNSILLRHAGGDVEIKKADVASRVNTGLSLMPEGLDALGPENIRDIIGYLSSDTGNFRLLNLSKVFTSDSRRGLYQSVDVEGDNLPFAKYGIVTVKGVPFDVVNPAKSATGRNVLTLKGGHGYAQTLPAKVEVKVGFAASRLHFLGGIGGWASKDDRDGDVCFKCTVVYADGQKEELTARDGVEFADYIGHFDVAGSMPVEGLLNGGHQVRAFTRVLTHGGVIDHIEIENPSPHIAPTTVAITAETGAGATSLNPAAGDERKPVAKAAPKASAAEFGGPVPQPPAKADGPRVLIVGGGSSHNFDKFFNTSDKATLAEIKPGWLDYTDNANGAPAVFANVDVLVWSANQKINDGTAKALKDWADAGKPLVLLHPGVWYNWPNFPAWNKEIVGGGTRGHDAIAEFEVKTVNANHPVMAGVSASFKITDELYNMVPDPDGTPIEVLATATSPKTGKTFPSVWIVKHPKARIVCIAPGHDARAHDLPEYKAILKNAVNWAVGK
jgi:putative heme-binding domain-containing protein